MMETVRKQHERSRGNKEAHGINGYSKGGFRANEKEVKSYTSKVDLFEVGLYAFMIGLVLLSNFA